MRWLRSPSVGSPARTASPVYGRTRPDQESFRAPRLPILDALRELEKQGVESPQEKEGSHAKPFACCSSRLRAVCAPRRRHRAPARADPRLRRPRRLELGLPLLRRLARLAGRARSGRGPGAGPGGARPRDASPLGPGPGPRGAVLREGPCPDPGGPAGDRSSAAGGRARGHGRPRRADRAGLAVRGPAGRGAGDEAPTREPSPARVSRRGRHGGPHGTTRTRGGGAAPAGAGRGPREPVSPGPAAGPGHRHRLRKRFRGNAPGLPAAGRRGEPLNLTWAIDVLHPLAQRARPCPPSEHGPTAASPLAIALGAGPPPILE